MFFADGSWVDDIHSRYFIAKFEPLFLHRALPVGGFVQWYNHEHLHSAINFVTPAQPHAGENHALLAKRVAIYQAAKEQHPERWSSEIRNWQRINIVHLNPEKNIIDKEQPAELKKAA